MDRVYLDYNATSPLRPEAFEAMTGMLGQTFGNPSSVHWAGSDARAALDSSRAEVAALAGVEPESMVFMSSATEANNTVFSAIAGRAPQHGEEIVTCATEHPSVIEAAESLRDLGVRVHVLAVDSDGRLDPERFRAALNDRTLLASVMSANNETGVIQPIETLAGIAKEQGVLFHTDAVQSFGKLALDFSRLPIDYASFSAHKLGGPKGCGALYVRPGRRFTPLLRGGPQERRRRAGTENLPGIVGFGAAATAALRDLETFPTRMRVLRDRLEQGILAKVPNAERNAPNAETLPHTLNMRFDGADGEALVVALDIEEIAVASGAACASGSTEPSHVLLAMGLAPNAARSSVRFSLGFDSTEGDVDRVLTLLPDVVARIRRAAP